MYAKGVPGGETTSFGLKSKEREPGMPTREVCPHEPRRFGLTGADLQRQLAAAESRCFAAGETLTPSRRQVLSLLLAADAPAKAYDLMAALPKGGRPAYPTTMYRTLEFLTGLGLAHRIEGLNAYVACRVGEHVHSPAILICNCCGTVEEFETDVARALSPRETRGFVVRDVTVEARGLCRACRVGKAQKNGG